MKATISEFTFIVLTFLGLVDLGRRLSSLPCDSFKHLLYLNIVALDTLKASVVALIPYTFENSTTFSLELGFFSF